MSKEIPASARGLRARTRGDDKVLAPSEINDMPHIFELMEKIMDFLTFINMHISEKLERRNISK